MLIPPSDGYLMQENGYTTREEPRPRCHVLLPGAISQPSTGLIRTVKQGLGGTRAPVPIPVQSPL